jgi:hypothetical protein
MNPDRVSPLRVVGLLGLVTVSIWVSRAAAAGVDSNRLDGLLIPLVFLVVAVSLVYPVIRWTRPGLIRWAFLMLVLALPLVVAVHLFAFWVL